MNKEKEVEAYLRGELPEEEKIKYEIAEEMGILDKAPRERLEKPFGQRNRQDRRPDDRPQERKGFHTLEKFKTKALSGRCSGWCFLCYT